MGAASRSATTIETDAGRIAKVGCVITRIRGYITHAKALIRRNAGRHE
jgi:hypothetical protein